MEEITDPDFDVKGEEIPDSAFEVQIPVNFKTYLGDGAYVDRGCYESEVVLTTEDGQSVQNRVVLGPTEVAVLFRWFEHRKLRWEAEAERRKEAGQ